MNRRVLLLGLLFAAAVLAFIGSAEAKMNGPCTAQIAGADFGTVDEVSIPSGASIPYSFSAPTALSSYELQLHYGPYSASPSSGTVESDQTSISGEVPMDKYAWLGTGLYSLTGGVVLADGSSCKGTINVNVEGNPLASAVGATAAAVTVGSTAGLIAMFLKAGAAAAA